MSRTITFLLLTALAAIPIEAQNLFAMRQTRVGLIQDNTARDVGDILTVVVRERHRVRNEDNVERTNTTSLAAAIEQFTLDDDTFRAGLLPELDVRQRREFEGDAKQEKDSNFEARVAVAVVDVLPNGNLVVAGTREVRIDDETKTLKISGLVRHLDIAADNTVQSSQVADARISIIGEGGNTRYTTRGPVGALFDTLIWAAWPF